LRVARRAAAKSMSLRRNLGSSMINLLLCNNYWSNENLRHD
jgi:hypothetical protein